MRSPVFVVWVKVTEDDLAALRAAGRSPRVHFLQADHKSLEPKIIESRARGAVIAIVSNDDEAGRALRAGADSVLRAGDTTWDRLESAMAQASESASVRLRSGAGQLDLEPTAFSLLMRALCRQIGYSLTTAWTQYESIAQRIDDVRQLNTKLMEWAALTAPPHEILQLRNRATILFSDDVQQMLERASGSLHRAEMALENAQLLSTGGQRTSVDVNVVLEELVELLREEVRAWADLRVRVAEKCEARVSVTFLVCLITAIIGVIVDAFRSASQSDGRIEIRASVTDGILVLELQDNGPPVTQELRASLHEGTAREAMLARIREGVRAMGAEMLIESSETGTIVRTYLSAEGIPSLDSAGNDTGAVESKSRTDLPLRPKS